MNTVVTGGTGFIGSWLIDELLKNGDSVTVLVRNKKKLLPHFFESINFRQIECEHWNLTDDQIYSIGPVEAFFHLAWAGVDSEHKNSFDTQLNNIRLATEALLIASRLKARKFIASGTVAEYVFSKDIMNVNEKQTPNDLYGAAKVSTHYFLDVMSRQLNQPFIWIIIPSTFGERRGDSNIITYTIKTLLAREKPKYGALQQMWDFLYVSEVARAIRLIGERGKPGKIYGIGSGIYRPLRDYIEEIRDIIDPSLPLGIGEYPAMSQQTLSSCVNIDLLTQDTGFVPEISFQDGIMRTIEYLRNHAKGIN